MGSRPNLQKKTLIFFVIVFLVLNLFYRGGQMVISRKTTLFQDSREGFQLFSGGGPTLSRGGGGESNFLFL